MRKIIPLIVLVLLSALFTNAQNINHAEDNLALQIVDANKAVIGISADLISNAKVFYTYEDKATGIRYVSLQQYYKDIPVYNQILALSFRNGKLLSNFGIFDPSIEKTVNVSSGLPSVTAESAVQSALSDRGFRVSQMAIAINRKDNGRFVEFGNMGISQQNITARLTWVPNELTKIYSLAWQVYIIPKTTADYWMVRVNAVDNSILGMDNYTDYDNWGTPETNANIRYPAFLYGNRKSNVDENNLFDFKTITDGPKTVTTATYRVIPIPAEAPSFPGGAPALRTDPWLAGTANATTLKWNTGASATDYDYSRGNNVWAYEDRANNNTGSIAKSASSTTALPNLTFNFVPDFTVDPTQSTPVQNQQFNITNLFYWNNIIHDVFYAYGFTEAGKNFQDDNLGRGGVGNDHVNAEAQDGGGTNNANFSTPADGGSGRMQMYLWTTATPNLDGDVDNGIIVHEYGHGISNRSNPGGTGCLGNAEQAGEGWSDYLALMLTQNWATATLGSGFNSPRGIGTYALNQPPTGAGIRPTRYCTDFSVNPTTYANLPGQAIPHGVGYVFCTALWEMTWELINDPSTTGIDPNIYNFSSSAGNVVALRLVMEGLRTQQCNPGFISSRNAIMTADTTLYAGIHACAILRAFARRGMGLGAAEGSTFSITDQTVSFNGGGPSMAFTQNGAAGIPELQNIIYNHAVTANCSAITNFTLRDTLPLNVTFVSATSGGTYAGGTRVVSWPVNVALNATQNYGLTVQINAGSYFPPVVLINEPVPTTTISGFWTTASTTANVWIAHNVRSHSAPNSFFTPDAGLVSDQTIATTASFATGATPPSLSFWHWYNTETNWDGAVLEISTNGGTTWSDIGAANFTQNGYNATINTSGNPLSGRAGWSGNSTAFVETKVNMNAYANQATVKLRWRFGSDASVGATGWNVDDILLQTIAVVNLRSNLFNASNVRVSFKDTVTVILPGAAVPPTVTINQAAAQPDPTSVSPINFTVVFDQVVTGFVTGDVVLTGTAGATTGTVTGSGTTYNVAVSGMTGSGTVIATVPAGVCINGNGDPNVASTSTDNTVTYNAPPPPPPCVNVVSYTGPAVAIPDNDPVGVDIPLTVSGIGLIADLNFRLDPAAVGTCDATVGNVNASIDHTWNGDLVVKLISPLGTTVTLINQRGGSGNNFCLVTLDDDGGFPPTSTMPTTGGITGNYAPENPLSAFDGQNANGLWRLNVSDLAAGDVGSVRRFSLIFNGGCCVTPTVNPVPNDTVCGNSTHPAVNFTGTPPGATFAWTNNNTAIGLGASGSGNIPAFTATNATVLPITGTVTVTPSVPLITNGIQIFDYTGAAQSWVVPAGVTSINIAASGAQGNSNALGVAGGLGGRAQGTLAVTPGQTLYFNVGGGAATSITGGFNGGGNAGASPCANAQAGGGGGASDVRVGANTLAARAIVAAGGGGAGGNRIVGCGRGTGGGGGAGYYGGGGGAGWPGVPGSEGPVPTGGTQSAGGAGGVTTWTGGGPTNGFAGVLGIGGNGGIEVSSGQGGSATAEPGGIGGGLTGGSGLYNNVNNWCGQSGAGGSSYIAGVTAGSTTPGVQSGNGQVVITYDIVSTCTGPSTTFTITVNPSPTVNPIPNQVVCQGLPTAPVNFTGPVAGTVFNWTNNTPAIGLAAGGTGNIASFIAQNPTLAPLVATITVTPVTGLNAPITQTFNYTGAVQTFTVPAGITSLNIKSWGAQGNTNALSVAGGLGGYAEGTLAVTPGQTIFINTGGGAATSVTGGFNGGGNAGANAGCANAQGGGGGGASDVRITANTLANRVIVGAGGGGAGGNRVAGCGRGSGGAGGGGYYGGGGGAGWPGVPGSQGPVPTGGTQSAGGAGGVTTWTGGGPTNGFAGVLGIGGNGGIEVGSSQGGSATAESGGTGGGLIGSSGNYNPANNWCGQSGAGGSSYIGGVSAGITTAGLRAGNGLVTITYTPPSATTCYGASRTFTITVNPNPSIVIIADPGSTICEGDPTLLTVRVGTSSPIGVLYNQPGVAGNGSPSQVFEPVNTAFNSKSADDFTVPAGTTWTVTSVTANGIGTGNPTSVNVFFYNNSGSNLPGTAVASLNNITTFVRTGGNYNITLPSSVSLGAGTYWVSVQVNMAFAGNGQWFWGNFGTTNIGNEYAWQNPGGGFGTPCTNWGYGATGCNVGGGVNRNNIFSIVGSSLADGGPLPGGYTFLWSPAAGLSSTTSNPVACAAMNTTLYTVNVTTGAGCTNQASILITVNKRPTVTVHPVSRVNCGGTSATFTVTGTGTNLAYQWQESLNGCAGPWTDLTNSGPYSGVNTATLTINPVSTAMNGRGYRVVLTGVCAPVNNANISNCALLTVNPLPNVAITPPGPVCGGVACSYGTQLSVGSAPPPVPGSVSVNSGTINLPVPDNTANGVSSIIAMAGVPANATITNISVALNMPHTYPHDMIFNLRAPNGQILSLYKHHTNTQVFPPASIPTAGWYNAVVNNTSTTAFLPVPNPFRYGQTAPAGPYKPDALNGVTSAGYTIMDPAGFVSNATGFNALYTTPASTTGNWTLAMADGGLGDFGTLTSWSITIDYTTPGSGGGPVLTYVWSPLAGLYTDAAACIPYTGTNTPIVYAAPTALTVYTVTATDVVTGCVNTASVTVNYTPPAPTVTPNPVAMCLGDPAVLLKSSSSTTTTVNFASGPISVIIPDATLSGATSNITVSGIPAAATIASTRVTFNINHTWDGDIAIALKAPNGNILNLDYYLSNTGGTGATTGFVNTTISSAGGPALSSGTNPYTGTFRADAFPGSSVPPAGPTSITPNVTTWPPLYSTPNGTWTLGMVDAFAGDQGTLTSWSINMTYVVGVAATPAVWTPAGGLFSDPLASFPYVTGTAVDSVWTRPTPSGVYNYDVTVKNVITTTSTISTPMTGGNGNLLVAFNVRNNNPYAVTFSSISSNTFGSGAVVSRVFYKAAPIAGNPGPISAANGWIQFGTANNTVVANTLNLLMTGLTLSIPLGATYGIALDMTGATFPRYTNGTGTIITYSNAGCDLITDGNVGWGGPAAPGTPANNPRNFNGSITLLGSGPGTCVSPARRVVVTVNQPTTITTQPVKQVICTDKVATFTVVAAGSGPFSYQWQESLDNGNTWSNITNGGVYSGATTATLTITAPPVTMSGNNYRVIITGAAPCAPAISFRVLLTVNPLPTIVITASPYTSLFPGLVTRLSSTVSPVAAQSYTWLRNGTPVSGGTNATLDVNVDGLGDYQLRVTDINTCTNVSNIITIKDSASGKCFIYPNPTSGLFEVRYYSVANNVLPRSLTVYDSKGDRVFTKFYTIGRPYDRMPVDMRAYGKGLYWVEIGDLNGNRLTMCRVVIQ